MAVWLHLSTLVHLQVWFCFRHQSVRCSIRPEPDIKRGGEVGFNLIAVSKRAGHQKPSISTGIKHVSATAIILRVTGGRPGLGSSNQVFPFLSDVFVVRSHLDHSFDPPR
ncbi:unnamed protein product [Pleuronectes platessa]|uniref:Secreted protein n=1 Tax=Pleuronectes platessa TaxID=8262 RepID=A0A9N7UNF9_PLEPL|nr:unnamed protein product [Pleuronectes platessa]